MLFVAYMAMSFWTIWFDMRKPFLMPFGIFKIFCSLGYKAPINDLPQGMDGLNKFGFGDANFQKWFADVNNRKYVSRLEFFAFNRQRLFELDAELTRRGLK
jgi:hypothetical protein